MHEDLLGVNQHDSKIIIDIIFEDRIGNEYDHTVIERDLDFDEPVDLEKAYEDGRRVARTILVAGGDPRDEKSNKLANWRERLEHHLPWQ